MSVPSVPIGARQGDRLVAGEADEDMTFAVEHDSVVPRLPVARRPAAGVLGDPRCDFQPTDLRGSPRLRRLRVRQDRRSRRRLDQARPGDQRPTTRSVARRESWPTSRRRLRQLATPSPGPGRPGRRSTPDRSRSVDRRGAAGAGRVIVPRSADVGLAPLGRRSASSPARNRGDVRRHSNRHTATTRSASERHERYLDPARLVAIPLERVPARRPRPHSPPSQG